MVHFLMLVLYLTLVRALEVIEEPKPAGRNWAVLVAGSRGWGNYRHQADVCHAFHILHDIGKIPKSQIVVMMADDIANNDENPVKGNIINFPNGPNVYPGVNKDYTGRQVTAKRFRKVLHELPTTKEDNIFIYFTDHGGKGMVAMPYGEPLYADEFMQTLERMHREEKYNEMVIYVEACESGSMFDQKLDDDLSIYATTASDDDHSSYAYYFDEKRGVYLADMYSIMWMEDSQINMTTGETLETQYLLVKNETTQSTVEEFGDLSIQKEKVVNFQASGFFTPKTGNVTKAQHRRRLIVQEDFLDQDLTRAVESLKKKRKRNERVKFAKHHLNSSVSDLETSDYNKPVKSWDVVLMTYKMRLHAARNSTSTDPVNSAIVDELEMLIADEENYREEVDNLFTKIILRIVSADNRYPTLPTELEWWFSMSIVADNFDCLRSTYRTYHNNCLRGFEDYSWKYVRIFANICMYYEKVKLSDMIKSCCA